MREKTRLPDDLVDRLEAARYLGLSPKTLDRWRSRRMYIPFTRLGNLQNSPVRYRRQDLDAFLVSQRVDVSPGGEVAA